MATLRKYKKHKIVITVEVFKPLTAAAVHDYVIEAVSTMHGCHSYRYDAQLTQEESESDEVMCGEIAKVTIGRSTWSSVDGN